MPKTLSVFSLVTLILLIVLLPSLLFSSGLASSLAMGTATASAILVGIALIRGWSSKGIYEATILTSASLLVIFIHLIFVSALSEVDFLRAFSSTIILVIMVAGSKALADFIMEVSPKKLENTFKVVLYFLFGLGFLGALNILQPFSAEYHKPVFPFSEPSFFAIVFVPFLIFICVLARTRERFFYIAATMFLALFLQNLTLVVGCGLAVLVSFRVRHSLFFILPAISYILFQIDPSYYVERINIFGETNNLSALVFLQGWQLVWASLIDTYGMGRGFQQLGIIAADVPAAEIISSIIGNNLNVLDGGFNFAKIVSEFGAIGIILILFYLKLLIKSFSALRKAATCDHCSVNVFAESIIFGYSLELFIRGAGYFTPTGLLLLAAFWIWRAKEKQKAVAYRGGESLVKKCYI